jgi:glyoxylase-like metal-dependent hydrolase (beta-lactamase superfamily II)
MKITEEIFQVGGSDLTSPGDGAVYLIHFDGPCALVDAGCGGSVTDLLDNVRKCGAEPDRIEHLLITHCHFDHTGGADELRRRTGCQIVAHERDAEFLEKGDNVVTAARWYGAEMKPFRVDRKLTQPREALSLGGRHVEAIHTPGHSPGSVVYLAESGGLKVLFAQDVHGPLDSRILLSNRGHYLRSLELLLSLEADVLCEGHFGVFRGKQEVADFIRTFLP